MRCCAWQRSLNVAPRMLSDGTHFDGQTDRSGRKELITPIGVRKSEVHCRYSSEITTSIKLFACSRKRCSAKAFSAR
jgi:hypothetical protein